MTLGESVLLARKHALMLSIYLPETHQLTVPFVCTPLCCTSQLAFDHVCAQTNTRARAIPTQSRTAMRTTLEWRRPFLSMRLVSA